MNILNTVLSVILALSITNAPKKNSTPVPVVPDVQYAYLPSDITIYSKNGNDYTAVSTLPKTYFVIVLEELNDKIRINYADIDNYYADKTAVEYVNYEPVTKYCTGVLTIDNDGLPVNLRSSPAHSSQNIITTINSDIKLEYYGKIEGSAIKEPLGKEWYFVKYLNSAETVRGYIYNGYASVSKIDNNIIEKVMYTPNIPTEDLPSIFEPSNIKTTLLIIALCIPAVLVMFFLFKKPSAKRRPRHQK